MMETPFLKRDNISILRDMIWRAGAANLAAKILPLQWGDTPLNRCKTGWLSISLFKKSNWEKDSLGKSFEQYFT